LSMITESTLGVRERVVDRRNPEESWATGTIFPRPSPSNDRFKIAQLLLETVCSTGGFVRGAKAQEIERHDAPTAGCQVGDQIVPDVQVIGKPCMSTKAGSAPL
jgi:hypothetical protein